MVGGAPLQTCCGAAYAFDILPNDCDADTVPDGCQPDCNANGTPDVCDIAGLTSADCNTNGIPDECELSAATDTNENGELDECELTCFDTCGDINGSGGNVDLVDFATLALCFLRSGPGPGCGSNAFAYSDMNGNGVVNLVDFATFALWFQNSTTQAPPDCSNTR